jgi:tRNA-2-methylthio-N6-dimethylallyladenosine synthase/ribosomal protein S12 methylthiotransferase
MEVQAAISRDLLAEYLGRDLDVLVERPHPEWPTLFEGRSWFQAPEVDGLTYVSGTRLAPGQMVRASVEQAWDYDLSALAESG